MLFGDASPGAHHFHYGSPEAKRYSRIKDSNFNVGQRCCVLIRQRINNMWAGEDGKIEWRIVCYLPQVEKGVQVS